MTSYQSTNYKSQSHYDVTIFCLYNTVWSLKQKYIQNKKNILVYSCIKNNTTNSLIIWSSHSTPPFLNMLEKIPTQSCGDDSDTESLDAVGPMVIIENMGGGGDLFDPVAEHHLLHLNDSSFDDDFSEYMWMLNEEEFDKEEMQRLEEEALMEQCIEAMFDLERAHRRAMDEGRQLVLPDELVDGEARPINADGSEVWVFGAQ